MSKELVILFSYREIIEQPERPKGFNGLIAQPVRAHA